MYIDIDAAKHAARRLRNLAKSSSAPMALNVAQRLVAVAAGHKDWHALENAIAAAQPLETPELHDVVTRLQDGGYKTYDPDGPMDVFDVAETLMPDEQVGPDDHLAVMAKVPDSRFLDDAAPLAGDEPGRSRAAHRRVELRGIDVSDPADDDGDGVVGDVQEGDDQPILWTITASVGDPARPDAVAQGQLLLSYGHDVAQLARALDGAGGGGAALRALDGGRSGLWAYMLIVTAIETRRDRRGMGHGTAALRALAAEAGEIRRHLEIDRVNTALSISDLPMRIADDTVRDAAHAWIGRPEVREALWEELRHPLPFHVVAGRTDERYRTKAPRSTSIRATARRRAGNDAPIVDWPAGTDVRAPLTGTFKPDADLLAWLPGFYVAANFTTAPTDWLAEGARSTVAELVLVDRDGGRTKVTQAEIEAAVDVEPDPADPLSVALRNLAIAYVHVPQPLAVDDVGTYILKRSSRMVSTTATLGGVDGEKLREALAAMLPPASAQESGLKLTASVAALDGGYPAYRDKAVAIVNDAERRAIEAIGYLLGDGTGRTDIAADQTLAREVVAYRREHVRVANAIGRELFERHEAEQAMRTAITPAARDLLGRLAAGGRVVARMTDDGEGVSWHAGEYKNGELCGMDDGLRLVRLHHANLRDMKLMLTWKGLDAARALGLPLSDHYAGLVADRSPAAAPTIVATLAPVQVWRPQACDQRLTVAPVAPRYRGDPTTHVVFTVSCGEFEMSTELTVSTVRTMDGFLAEAGRKAGEPLSTKLERRATLTIGDADRPASLHLADGCDRAEVVLAAPLHRMLRKLLKEAVRPGAREAVFEPVEIRWTSIEEPV